MLSFKDSSPGVYRTLANFNTKEVLLDFEACFAFSATNSDEPPLSRKDDSFSPRSARLMQILIRTYNETRPEILLAAMLAAAKLKDLRDWPATSPLTQTAKEIALRAQDCTSSQQNADSERVALAKSVDLARHLHMCKLSLGEKLALANQLLLQTNSCDSANNQLKEMLLSSIQRFKDHATENS